MMVPAQPMMMPQQMMAMQQQQQQQQQQQLLVQQVVVNQQQVLVSSYLCFWQSWHFQVSMKNAVIWQKAENICTAAVYAILKIYSHGSPNPNPTPNLNLIKLDKFW